MKGLWSGIAALGLAVAVSGAAQAADKPVYAVLLKTLANPYWGAMELGLREGAGKDGVEPYVTAVESESAVEPQLNACLTRCSNASPPLCLPRRSTTPISFPASSRPSTAACRSSISTTR